MTEILAQCISMQVSGGCDSFIGCAQLEICFSISHFNYRAAQSYHPKICASLAKMERSGKKKKKERKQNRKKVI